MYYTTPFKAFSDSSEPDQILVFASKDAAETVFELNTKATFIIRAINCGDGWKPYIICGATGILVWNIHTHFTYAASALAHAKSYGLHHILNQEIVIEV